MALSDLQVEKFSVGKGIYWSGAYPVYGKMFQPYDWADIVPSSWTWDDIYTMNETTSFDVSGFQQGNEVFAGTILISNQSTSPVTFEATMYLDQKINGHWQNPGTSNFYLGSTTIRGKTGDTTWGEGYAFWGGVDTDEIREGITEYRLRLYTDSTQISEIQFSVYGFDFDTTVCNSGYMRVEGANICYVPPCYYSGTSHTGYKHIIQYDTGYSGATGQTPGMIRVPNDSSDWHIYYTTSNGVVRRTKETYPRVPTTTVSSSKRGHIWMTPSTSWSTEETGYNYICYVDNGGRMRRLGPGNVD